MEGRRLPYRTDADLTALRLAAHAVEENERTHQQALGTIRIRGIRRMVTSREPKHAHITRLV